MKKCKACGTEFEPKNSKGVFCSTACRQKNYREGINKLLTAARKGDSMAVIDMLSNRRQKPKSAKPLRMEGEDPYDYAFRVSAWKKENQ